MDKKMKVNRHQEQEQRNHALNQRRRTWWNGCLQSPLKRMSCGAQYLAKCITWPHNDNWRRKNIKK